VRRYSAGVKRRRERLRVMKIKTKMLMTDDDWKLQTLQECDKHN